LEEGRVLGFSEGEAKGFAGGKASGLIEGEAKGFAEGETKGFTEGERTGREIREEELREYEQTHQLLLRLIEDMKTFTETVLEESENDLLQVAMGIAQKIVKTEITQNPEAILESVQEALKQLSPMEAASIRVHPQDVEMLMRKRPELLEAIEGTTALKIEPDPRLSPGDCMLETPKRIVDLRPDMQLAEIRKKLLPEG
jgi:flagellar assembly protein FliH